MPTFTPGQKVVTLRNTPVLNGAAQTLYDLATGATGTIISGPHQVMNKPGEYWKLHPDDGRLAGYAKGDRLADGTPNPGGDGTGRRIYLRLAHHDGDPHPIFLDANKTRYLKTDATHDAWLGWIGGGWVVAQGYAYVAGQWLFEIEKISEGGAALWGEAPLTGWIEYTKNNVAPTVTSRLEVAVQDGQAAPNFDAPPSVEPPPPPPPPDPIPDPLPIPDPANNLVVNGDFGQGWTTDTQTGNQTPNGWTLEITPNGQPNLWPTHLQGGNTIPSVAKIVPECVHKLPSQLPPNEQKGQPRALLIGPAVNVYKLFGKDAWSAKLRQTLEGLTPEREVRVVAYVLAETPDNPTAPDGKLEPDHFHISLATGMSFSQRRYSEVVNGRDVPSNERAWVRLQSGGVVPPNGILSFVLEFQQNWPGVCDFFVGPVTALYVDDVPPVVPPPPPPPPDGIDATAILAAVAQIEAQAQQIRNLLGRG